MLLSVRNIIAVTSVLIIFLDWIFVLNIADQGYGIFFRSFNLLVLVIFLAFFFRLRTYLLHPLSFFLLFYLAMLLIYPMFSPDISANYFSAVRIMYWLVASFAFFQITLEGKCSLDWAASFGTVCGLVASSFTVGMMLNPFVEPGQNASAYLILWCLPLILLRPLTKSRGVVFLLCLFAILLTVKRGAALALIASLFVLYVANGGAKISVKSMLWGFSSSALIILVAVLAISIMGDAYLSRLEDTTGSGRTLMYVLALQHWINGSAMNLFFGFGINSVQDYLGFVFSGGQNAAGKYAHSDWVQLIHDFGLLGFILLVSLHVRMLRLIWLLKRWRRELYPSTAMAYTILFCTNIYSGQLAGPDMAFFGIFVGVVGAELLKVQRSVGLNQPKVKLIHG